jgi:hypothetical protein
MESKLHYAVANAKRIASPLPPFAIPRVPFAIPSKSNSRAIAFRRHCRPLSPTLAPWDR